MKFEIDLEQLEEMVCCIVDCGLDRDEACEYAKNVLLEFNDIKPQHELSYLED